MRDGLGYGWTKICPSDHNLPDEGGEKIKKKTKE
jgi:hypothetical protein